MSVCSSVLILVLNRETRLLLWSAGSDVLMVAEVG